MKRIGFATEFFTLWEVESVNDYATINGVHTLSSTRTINTYIQNLSKTESAAIAKAQSMGCHSSEIDEDLKGKSRSFTKYVNHCSQEERELNEDEFQYGKFVGQKIAECSDLGYLLWYSKHNQYSIKRILELSNDYVLVDGNDNEPTLFKKSEAIIHKITAEIKAGQREVIAVSNFASCEKNVFSVSVEIDPENEDDYLWLTEYPYGYKLYIKSTDLTLERKTYQGFEYYTPKGMRSFKKTRFTVHGEKINLK